jgi:hypothetical protein
MKLLIAITLLSLPLFARDATLSIPFPEGVDKIEYDDAKFSESQIRTIFTHLSPELAPFYGYMVPGNLGLCVSGDENYKQSGDIRSLGFSQKLKIAGQTFRASEKKLAEVRDGVFPEELNPVQRYLKQFLGAGIRMQKCQLEFYKTGDAAGLKACDTLEGAPECNVLVKKIADANDPSEKLKLGRAA